MKLKAKLKVCLNLNSEREKQIHELKQLISNASKQSETNGGNNYECTICATELFDDHCPVRNGLNFHGFSTHFYYTNN